MSSAARQLHLNPITSDNLLDPVPLYRELRQNEPLHWSDAVRAWFVTRHADVVDGFRDARLATPPATGVQRLLHVEDGRERMQLRRRTAAGFTPQALHQWRGAVRQLVEEQVARLQPRGRMDAVRELLRPLPSLVMAELLGIPDTERATFLEALQVLAQLHAPEADTDEASVARRAHEALTSLLACLGRTVDVRRHAPGEDLISRMLGSGDEEDPERWLPQAVLQVLSEHASTADQLGNGLHELLAHPGQYDKLREDPILVRQAVEEVLRVAPTQPFALRVVAETFQWQGRTLRKGDAVFLGVAAANRDPRIIPDPDRCDVTRDRYEQRHLSFGFGAHHRLCASLVRLELETLFEVLLARLPGLRLDGERLPRLKCHSLLYRGFETLPLKW